MSEAQGNRDTLRIEELERTVIRQALTISRMGAALDDQRDTYDEIGRTKAKLAHLEKAYESLWWTAVSVSALLQRLAPVGSATEAMVRWLGEHESAFPHADHSRARRRAEAVPLRDEDTK